MNRRELFALFALVPFFKSFLPKRIAANRLYVSQLGAWRGVVLLDSPPQRVLEDYLVQKARLRSISIRPAGPSLFEVCSGPPGSGAIIEVYDDE